MSFILVGVGRKEGINRSVDRKHPFHSDQLSDSFQDGITFLRYRGQNPLDDVMIVPIKDKGWRVSAHLYFADSQLLKFLQYGLRECLCGLLCKLKQDSGHWERRGPSATVQGICLCVCCVIGFVPGCCYKCLDRLSIARVRKLLFTWFREDWILDNDPCVVGNPPLCKGDSGFVGWKYQVRWRSL